MFNLCSITSLVFMSTYYGVTAALSGAFSILLFSLSVSECGFCAVFLIFHTEVLCDDSESRYIKRYSLM